MFTSLPTPDRLALEIRSWGRDAGYREMFGRLWERQLGLPAAVVTEVAELPRADYLERSRELLSPHVPAVAETVAELSGAGITRAVVHAPLPVDVPYPVAETAALVAEAPEILRGFARVDGQDLDRAAEEVRAGVAELGLGGITLTPFWHGISCDDPRLEPILDVAAEYAVPLWVHTSMNWVTHRELELEHPRHVDRLAGRRPDVTIVCGHAGWPWVQEMVAVAWRHPNVYIDYSAFRPKHLFVPGAGWEPLAYHGSRGLREKIVYGSTWALLGRPVAELIAEARSLPWPESTSSAWLHDNAARVLDARHQNQTEENS
jgi:predicted TIM-barrel fold metal-dependent hydrolase